MTAAGYFAFVSAIGIITTYAQRSHTGSHMMRYEDAIMVGAIAGNTWWIMELPIHLGWAWLSYAVFAVFGFTAGVFTGSLVIALAETIKAIPIFFRRTRITLGLAVVIIAFALGKTGGNLIYYIFDLAAAGR